MSGDERIRELEELVSLLQQENDQLSELAEDSLLLGRIGERIGAASRREDLLEAVLEEIALLKDVPYCASLLATEDGAKIDAVYCALSHHPHGTGAVLSIPPSLFARAILHAEHLPESACRRLGLSGALAPLDFEPASILLVGAKTKYAPRRLFLFAENRPGRPLDSLTRALARSVEIVAARLDTLFLVDSLKELNEGLDRKVEERTAALALSENRFRSLFESMHEGFALVELLSGPSGEPVDYRFLAANPAFVDLAGLSSGPPVGQTASEMAGKAEPWLLSCIADVVRTGKPGGISDHPIREGRIADIDLYRPEASLCAILVTDVTARRQAEAERVRLEQQFRHAQKMEAVGRLAGGVAHDFNNILTAIFGYCELLSHKLANTPAAADLAEIRGAAERAASLTQQLLAFSRKQVLQPKPIDLVDSLERLRTMLRRLIGEDIHLDFDLSPSTGRISADPGQIQQVILNLAINARDAMPEGGVLTISSESIDCDEEYVRAHHVPKPGRYVVITVTDTGCGMDAQTRSHLFEPFFTTKEPGKGTGLGLATVHGIVTQSGGHIWVYSEKGQGTAFRLYFPRLEGPGEVLSPPPAVLEASGGSETILLVEDAPDVRQLVLRVLTERGYHVLEARSSDEALDVSRSMPGTIHMLLTDVVIPGMNGRRLAELLEMSRPGLKVLYMSGYTANLIVHHGVLERGIHFIQKPFAPSAIAAKVREVLDHT